MPAEEKKKVSFMISRLELRKSICNTDAFRERFVFAAAQFQKQQKGVGFFPLKY